MVFTASHFLQLELVLHKSTENNSQFLYNFLKERRLMKKIIEYLI